MTEPESGPANTIESEETGGGSPPPPILPVTRGTISLLVGLAGLAGLIWLAILARPLLVALLLAGLLAYLLNPLVLRLQRRLGDRRALAAALTYALILLLLLGLVGLLGAAVWDQLPRLVQEATQAWTELNQWLTRPFEVLGFRIDPQAAVSSLEQSAGNALTSLPLGSANLLAGVTDNLLWTLVVFVGLYYFLKDGPQLRPWLIGLLPPAYQASGETLLDELDAIWGVFLRVQLLIFLVLAVLLITSTGLLIWLFRQGWLPLSPVGLVVLLVIVYAAIQQVDNLWLRPQLMGSALRLHPGVVFVGLIAGLALSGVLGALLIVPALASLKLIGRRLIDAWHRRVRAAE